MTTKPPKLSRRRFLRGMAAAGAGLLAACATEEPGLIPQTFLTATPARVLRSPQAPPEETLEPREEGQLSLEDFLALSSLLTGVDNLDPGLGRVYLQALEAGEDGPSPAEVFDAARDRSGALAQDIETLEDAGFFDQPGTGAAADQIISMWYTGVTSQDGEDVVVTFVDALAWKVLHFTKPLTICASFGFWSEEPRAQISPTFEYTPVPMEESGQ